MYSIFRCQKEWQLCTHAFVIYQVHKYKHFNRRGFHVVQEHHFVSKYILKQLCLLSIATFCISENGNWGSWAILRHLQATFLTSLMSFNDQVKCLVDEEKGWV